MRSFSRRSATVEAQRFVSIPSTDPTRPSPHNTGASVDLTIVKFSEQAWEELQALQNALSSENWETVYKAEMRKWQILIESAAPLNMGTAFDEVSPATLTRYYEEKVAKGEALSPRDQEALNNRRMFIDVMTKAGFSNYHEEWWHFDFGNQFDAKRTGRSAIYGSATFSPECTEHEDMRRKHLAGTEYYKKVPANYHASKLGAAPLTQFVSDVARNIGDLRKTSHEKAQRLIVSVPSPSSG
jgi:zinc D-Ala-D-Ala dipeptidase